MAVEAKEILDMGRKIIPYRNTRRGLAAELGLCIIACFLIPVPFPASLLGRVKLCPVLLIIIVAVWWLSRIRRKKRDTWVVVLSLETDPEAEKYLNKVLRGISKKLSLVATKHRILVRRLHHDDVRSRTDADKLLNDGKADLVIWGNFTDAAMSGEPVSYCDSINYTHRLTPIMVQNFEVYKRDMCVCFGTRKLIVRHKESLSDLIGLQTNFSDVALFIIGIQMFSDAVTLNDSVMIFRQLLEDAKALGNQEVAARLQSILAQAVYMQSQIAINSERWPEAKVYIEEAKALGCAGFGIDAGLALICFQIGDEAASRRHVRELLRQFPNSTTALFDTAFFAIRDKEYNRAKDIYDQVNKIKKIDHNPQSLLKFFSRMIDSDDPEIAYVYARGIANLWYGDRSRGIVDLKSFIAKAEHISDYNPMIVRATDLLTDAERREAQSQRMRAENVKQRKNLRRKRRCASKQ